MVILPDQGWVWVSVPKSGTHTMYDVLERSYPTSFRGSHFHCRRPAKEWEHLPRFVVVRNPYRRAVSLWWHLLHRLHQDRRRPDWVEAIGDLTCEEFCCWLVTVGQDPPQCCAAGLLRNQATWLARVEPKRVLHIEHLDAELPSLGLDPAPQASRALSSSNLENDGAEYGDWRTHMSAKAAKAALEWSRPDFEQYEYSTDLDDAG